MCVDSCHNHTSAPTRKLSIRTQLALRTELRDHKRLPLARHSGGRQDLGRTPAWWPETHNVLTPTGDVTVSPLTPPSEWSWRAVPWRHQRWTTPGWGWKREGITCTYAMTWKHFPHFLVLCGRDFTENDICLTRYMFIIATSHGRQCDRWIFVTKGH